jgi:cytochrome c-type biogenesis protein CcmH
MNSRPDQWRRRCGSVLAVALICVAVAGSANSLADTANDTAQIDARTRELAASFRCLVCQNQTLEDSTADLAADLRERIREQVRDGATDAQVRDYMVRRYGDFVLYQPPLRPLTWALWFGPFVALAVAALALLRSVRQRRRVTVRPLDADERRRADALLAASDEGHAR